MAYHAERCPCIRQSLRQVPKVWQPNQATGRRAHPNDGPMAFRSIGVRYHGSVPTSGQTFKVSSSWYKLLHQVGRSRNPGHHHEEECTKLHMEKHHLQVRYTSSIGLRQREAIRQQSVQKLLFIARDQESLLVTFPPLSQRTS